MTRKDIVEKYSPNDINENNKGGVYGCPYENRYSDFLFVTEKECVCSCENIEGCIPAEACEKCWNTDVN